jgi:acyl carrier protein
VIAGELRRLLADVAGDPEVASYPDEVPLIDGGVGLGSLEVAELLDRIRRRFGVDVAHEDLNLDSIETIGTLVSYVVAAIGTEGRR